MRTSASIKLSIVFLNYNRLNDTRVTVDQLRSLVGRRADIEVIAVDNGSTDGTAAFLRQQMDWMRVLLLDSNKGIGGLNEGFMRAVGDYIMVLDDDSHPRDVATIDRQIQLLDQRKDIGVVACRIDSLNGVAVRTWHLPGVDAPGPAMAFVGCGFAIRRELFERIGWFPDHFFLYQNEVETAIRVMKAGYGIYYTPECRVIHRESVTGRTSWRRVFFPTRNTIWIIRRYFPAPESSYMIGSRLVFGLVRALQSGNMGCYLAAIVAGFRLKIEREKLPQGVYRRLRTFKQHNSLFHHLAGVFRFK